MTSAQRLSASSVQTWRDTRRNPSNDTDLLAKIQCQLSKETCCLTKGRYLVTPVQGIASNATQMWYWSMPERKIVHAQLQYAKPTSDNSHLPLPRPSILTIRATRLQGKLSLKRREDLRAADCGTVQKVNSLPGRCSISWGANIMLDSKEYHRGRRNDDRSTRMRDL